MSEKRQTAGKTADGAAQGAADTIEGAGAELAADRTDGDAGTAHEAETWTTKGDDPAYSLTDDGESLTLRMGGAAYRNLKRIADALNRVDIQRGLEDGADNTPLSVFWNFALDWARFDYANDAKYQADLVCDGIAATPEFIGDLRAEFAKIEFEG